MTRSPRSLLFILAVAVIVSLWPASPNAFLVSATGASKSIALSSRFTLSNGFRSSAVASVTGDFLGRWKLDGSGGCYWDENDDGPDQCDPNNPDGRYKDDGYGGCYWEPNDFGPDQCDPNSPPPSGQYRLDGDGRCYFDPNGTGAHQCTATPIGPGDGYGADVQTPCGLPATGCAPARLFVPARGTLCYTFSDAGVPQDRLADWGQIKAAFDRKAVDWNKQLRDWRMPNRLEKCSGGYTISWAPNLGGYGLTSVNTDRKSGTIQISSSVALDAQSAIHGEDYMYDYVGGHELGHVLGFSDTSCGQSNSIMNGVLNPSTGHVQTMTCADLLRFYDDRKNGYGGGTTGSGGPNPGGYEEGDCRHEQFGEWDDAKIEFCSPIVIDLDAGPFEMSPPDVWFNLTGKGPRWFGWTPSRSTTVGWLALDRDGDGMITSGAELFGNFTPLGDSTEGPMARHGFEALAWFDQPSSGGNGDGWVDRADGIYGRLRMWFDENHDGVSQRAELQTLTKSRVLAISVRAFKSQRRDKFGNEIFFRSETRVVLSNGAEVRRPAYDVLLVVR